MTRPDRERLPSPQWRQVGEEPDYRFTLLLRPSEVLSGIANPPILKVAKNALRSLLQHSHMRGGRFA